MDRRTTIVVAATFLIVLMAISPSIVSAKCNPNRTDDRQYYWDGRGQTPGTTVEGVSSNIYVYSPFVWPSGRFSYAWVMLTRSGSYYWAQIGPEHGRGVQQ